MFEPRYVVGLTRHVVSFPQKPDGRHGSGGYVNGQATAEGLKRLACGEAGAWSWVCAVEAMQASLLPKPKQKEEGEGGG